MEVFFMKKFLGLLLIIAMIALLAGCGGSSNPGGNNPGGNDPVKQLVIKWSSATPANSIAAKSVSPGPIEYPDGKDGKYIGGTAYVYQGTNWSRTVYLEAEFYQDGQRVNFTLEESNKVLWT
jgi:hypothetical protein